MVLLFCYALLHRELGVDGIYTYIGVSTGSQRESGTLHPTRQHTIKKHCPVTCSVHSAERRLGRPGPAIDLLYVLLYCLTSILASSLSFGCLYLVLLAGADIYIYKSETTTTTPCLLLALSGKRNLIFLYMGISTWPTVV